MINKLISREALKKYARIVFDKDLGRLQVVDVSDIDNVPTVEIATEVYDIFVKAKYAAIFELHRKIIESGELTPNNIQFVNLVVDLLFRIYDDELHNVMRGLYDNEKTTGRKL